MWATISNTIKTIYWMHIIQKIFQILTYLESWVQDMNFREHICLSKGNFDMSSWHEALILAGGYQKTFPLWNTIVVEWKTTPIPEGSPASKALSKGKGSKQTNYFIATVAKRMFCNGRGPGNLCSPIHKHKVWPPQFFDGYSYLLDTPKVTGFPHKSWIIPCLKANA